MAQASSYDRRSNPGPDQDWFANGDAGQFIRDEVNEGRTEHVMMDADGPGALVRFWSANPQGTVRFYFDGASSPTLSANMQDLLSGKIEPFFDPIAYTVSHGFDLYFPFPYAKHLKVTVEGSRGLYYHLGYRTYDESAVVKTYDPSESSKWLPTLKSISAKLLSGPQDGSRKLLKSISLKLGPDSTKTFEVSGGGAHQLSLLQARLLGSRLFDPKKSGSWTDRKQTHNILRHILLDVYSDGKLTIRTPLSDFFVSPAGLHSYGTLPMSVFTDGTMTSRLVMPYQRGLQFKVTNLNTFPVDLDWKYKSDAITWSSDTYALHAEWNMDFGPTRPMRDMHLLNPVGEGNYVGTALHITNPTPAWWGEGDEKVYVDGESFPSTFGTGTEDFFGYAWSSAELFQHPYHAQSWCDGPGTMGHDVVMRFQTFDPIPFKTGLKFDLEMWHWENVQADFDHVVFWYAKPGSHQFKPIQKDSLTLREIAPPAPVKGAIEGEGMKIVKCTGGQTENQEGFWQISAGKQLWWQDGKVGDVLEMQFKNKTAGNYEIVANMCHAMDYGIHKISINGKEAKVIDFYGDLTWEKASLGSFKLPAGDNTITVECVGTNVKAKPARMFGLDYILLVKK